MALVVHCRDVGFDCDGVVRAETEEELLQQVAGHAKYIELILEKMAVGETIEQILEAHSRLTLEGIQAALALAAEALRTDVVYPHFRGNQSFLRKFGKTTTNWEWNKFFTPCQPFVKF